MKELPTRLGKYDIVRALGSGAMGVVYEAVDSVIERTVAIKTIRKVDLDPDEAAEHTRRFLIEARAAGKLNHPHIISLYDHGDQAGMAYIVMELVQGRELQHYFDERYRFSPDQVLRLMGELLDALGYSHRRGVVHRDVKPANIFINEAGSIKLGDFGIARIESTQKTRAGAPMGTPSYMSPEQIRGEPADARSDLYAAGVVLFQFLTGERPYGGGMLAMALKVLNEPVPRASLINPAVSPALDAVIDRALAKQARDRFQSAAEFWQALAAAAGVTVEPASSLSATGAGSLGLGPGDSSSPIGTTGWGQGGSGAVQSTTGGEAAGGSVGKSSRGLVGVAGLALLVIAGGWWWTQGRGAAPVDAQPNATEQLRQQTPTGTATDPATATAVVPAPAPAPALALTEPAPIAPPPAMPPAPPPQMTPAPATNALPAASQAGAEIRPAVRPQRAAPLADRPARSAAPVDAATPPARAARSPRCSDILQKASLEALTAEEGAYLRKECQ